MSIGDKIREYRLLRGMTQQDIADALGESSGRVVYNWEKGIGRPDCEKIARLCELLDVSADELIGCKSMVGRPTAVEWETLQKYRALDEHGRDVVDYLLESEYQRVTTIAKNPKVRMLKIDYYNYPASAGTGSFLETEIPEQILVKESTNAENADYVIPIMGDSMEPTFHGGDKVFVEKCDSVDIGEIGIFVVNGDAFIKEFGDKCLISHNEKYKPITLSENDSVYCFGRVIGVVEE
jgi:SOS-response transcriptional repressor LexA